uniref:Uncharacterized protein n=1 Tax=Anguilla anguilla TaxID=7936 RepID=A0A0E9VNP0_ANGAN
MLVSKTVPIFQ